MIENIITESARKSREPTPEERIQKLIRVPKAQNVNKGLFYLGDDSPRDSVNEDSHSSSDKVSFYLGDDKTITPPEIKIDGYSSSPEDVPVIKTLNVITEPRKENLRHVGSQSMVTTFLNTPAEGDVSKSFPPAQCNRTCDGKLVEGPCLPSSQQPNCDKTKVKHISLNG